MEPRLEAVGSERSAQLQVRCLLRERLKKKQQWCDKEEINVTGKFDLLLYFILFKFKSFFKLLNCVDL